MTMPNFKSASTTGFLTFLLIMGLGVFFLSTVAVCQDESPPKFEIRSGLGWARFGRPVRPIESPPQMEPLPRDSERRASPLTLVNLPQIEVTVSTMLTEEEVKTIEALIKDLAQSRQIDFGSTFILTGEDFAPIGDSEESFLGSKATHWLKGNKSFKRLVALGPKALPVLLKSLDDPNPTGLKVKSPGLIEELGIARGTLSFGRQIWGNPLNPIEAKVLANVESDLNLNAAQFIPTYTVKVGDLCFEAIGQITNRPYLISGSGGTRDTIVNSPVHDKQLASLVKHIWGKPDPQQTLLNSLLIDFHTRGESSENLQVGAAKRLAFYFPKETSALIAERLKTLDVETRDYEKRNEINGLRAEDLIQAVSWSNDPKIQNEALRIFNATTDTQVLVAALPGIDQQNAPQALERLNHILKNLPETDGPRGEGYEILLGISQRFPEAVVKSSIDKYLKTDALDRRLTVCRLLETTNQGLSIEILSPLLQDKRETKETYVKYPDDNTSRFNRFHGFGLRDRESFPENYPAIRVCDEAAKVLANNFEKWSFFELRGSHEDLDKKIELILWEISQIEKKK